MGRPIRIEYPGALYHITSRGNERKTIFLDEADRRKFLSLLGEYHDRYGIVLHTYVLMDNHYHIILETPRGNLLKVMHGLNSGYTGYFNRRHGRVGHLFQGRYRAILVEKDSYLVPLSRYVHLNPVRAGVVEKPEQYAWSSYLEYIGRGRKERWMEYDGVLCQFSTNRRRAERKYIEYLREAIKKKTETPLKEIYGQVILGGEGFGERIKRMLKGKRLSQDVVARKKLKEHATLGEIVEAVRRVFGVNKGAILGTGSKENRARKVALYLAHQHSGLSNEEIGMQFGGIHYSAVSKAATRVREEIASDKDLAKLVNELDSHFKA